MTKGIITLCGACFVIIVVLAEFFSITRSAPSQSSSNTSQWMGIPAPCLCQEFRCAGGTFCLHKSKVCSGYRDCPDGEDENLERCNEARGTKPKVKCSKEEFKCKFGGCIKLSKVCDREINCWGGVDEASDFCSWVKS